MEVHAAQRELRLVYRGGAIGQLVSGLIWLGSAALGTWGTSRQAILFLVIGGMFIFPLTTLGLLLLGGPTRVSAGNPLHGLGAQVALVLPLTLPVVGAAAMHRLDWFYPAFMVALGAHYLPFVFLYGMRLFGLLAVGLVALGLAMSQQSAGGWADPAWITGAVLLLFSAAGWMATRHER
ncbi:MAG TPA: hypothetical protein VF862_10315 [Gemmatimonadales bacterium]